MGSESTVHEDKYSYATLLTEYQALPKNFSIFEGSMEEAYLLMDMCLSCSSTVSIEALYYKIPSFIIADLGISEKRYNYPFLGSGLFITFDELIYNDIPSNQIEEEWYKKHVDFDINRDIHLKKIISEKKLSSHLEFKPNILFGGGFRFTNRKNIYIRKIRKLFRSPILFILDSKFIKPKDN